MNIQLAAQSKYITHLGVSLLALMLAACSLTPRVSATPTALPSPVAVPTIVPLPTLRPYATLVVLTPIPTETTPLPLTPTTTPSTHTILIVPTSQIAPGTTPVAVPGDLEQQLFVQINMLRSQNQLPSYRLESSLSDAARAHSCDMATNSFINHTGSDGRSVRERIQSAWAWPSESIAAGTADPASVIALWMDEPEDGPHRRNLLDPDQQVIGVGYCFREDDPTGNQHYWTIDLARPA